MVYPPKKWLLEANKSTYYIIKLNIVQVGLKEKDSFDYTWSTTGFSSKSLNWSNVVILLALKRMIWIIPINLATCIRLEINHNYFTFGGISTALIQEIERLANRSKCLNSKKNNNNTKRPLLSNKKWLISIFSPRSQFKSPHLYLLSRFFHRFPLNNQIPKIFENFLGTSLKVEKSVKLPSMPRC